MMKWLGCLLCVFAVQAQVFGAGCRFNTCHRVYHAPYVAPVQVIEKKIVVTEFVPFIAYVPVALATYVPVAAAPAIPLAASAPVPYGVPPALPVPQAQLPVAVPAVPVDPCAARMAPLLARLEALERQLQQGNGGVPNGVQAQPMAKGLALAQNKCAKCHEAAVAEKDGGGFTMFEQGKMVELTDRQSLLCFKKVITGQMPPPKEGKLEDADGRAVLEFFDTYKATKRSP